jgi:hypothetical protein
VGAPVADWRLRVAVFPVFGLSPTIARITLGQRKEEAMKTRILVGLIAMFAVSLSGVSISYADEFKWGDTTGLKEHLDNHVKFPATGKVIKESCRKELPDEFAKQQYTYLDSKLKDDTVYKNPAEVLSAMNLK